MGNETKGLRKIKVEWEMKRNREKKSWEENYWKTRGIVERAETRIKKKDSERWSGGKKVRVKQHLAKILKWGVLSMEGAGDEKETICTWERAGRNRKN